ncbi:hypothetical protein R3P38DRAFT_3176259 [Favolaschia claudopus]|uniref:Uncharacterized protein n=1 Tax=Favolaschia claudopus TaxID=2862362 RepID=A0AAW0D3G0_9AGAR
MFKLLALFAISALIGTSAAVPVRGHHGQKQAATGSTAAANTAVGTPCTAGAGGADAALPLCKDTPNGFGCTFSASTNACFGTPPCPGTVFTPADTAGLVCG